MNSRMKPIVAITMGDAAGIGPEIIAKALSHNDLYQICKPLIIGDARVMDIGIETAQVKLQINSVKAVGDSKFLHGTIDVLSMDNIDFKELKMGQPQAMAGKASVEYIQKAVKMASDGDVHAIATAPISKEAINMANYRYSGHTEILAHLTNTKKYAMMLVVGHLRVIHVTTHIPYIKVPQMIKKDRVFATIELAYDTLRKFFAIDNPRIGVAGLNPHAGERGLFGREEIEEITPAIESAKRRGIDATGPIPADTVFTRAQGKEFDAVIAMYHDQGHIPIKLIGFRLGQTVKELEAVEGVNLTLGLPIIRTSVDHGTAYGKAGRKEGTANPQSLIEAIKLAAEMAILAIDFEKKW